MKCVTFCVCRVLYIIPLNYAVAYKSHTLGCVIFYEITNPLESNPGAPHTVTETKILFINHDN